MGGRHFHILLVEDHPSDVTLTRKAFARIETPNTLHVAIDGFEAIAFLHREGRFREVPRPDLILLDLNMPRRDGRAVLRDVKADESLRAIPIVVLTTSSAAQDVRQAYALHANGYVTKPVGLEDFLIAVRAIEAFWLTVAQLPPTQP